MKIKRIRMSLVVGIIFLLIFSLITSVVIGFNVNRITFGELVNKFDDVGTYYCVDKYFYPEGYFSEKCMPETYADVKLGLSAFSIEPTKPSQIDKEKKYTPPAATSGGPMDSPWPMHGHDVRHTGRSSYSTVDTWDLSWRFDTAGWALGSPSIDDNGTIYIGSWYFYAVFPNGTIKWKYNPGGGTIEHCCPAIDEDGVIYVGTSKHGGYLHAVNPDGTLKWKYPANSYIVASPAIDSDGVIYYAGGNAYPESGHITALYPNGTLKWRYPTNHVMYSSPAIGLDGTIYCGSHDNNVYALYPNNGTLKWKYNTGSWVHGSPTVADDGTVYIGSDNGYLYAFYPNNGAVKWKLNIGAVQGSLALDKDGTIYTGVWEKTFYAIYPNGTIKWSFNTGGGKVWGSSPALSDDDTIYFGTCDLEWSGGIEIIALYTDGTVKWRKGLDTVFSSPAIGSDGTVYIGSCSSDGGYLNAYGLGDLEADANGPYYRLINEPVQFMGSFRGGYSPHTYFWDFGDGGTSEEQNPTYIYTDAGNYTVTLTVTDNSGNQSSDTTWAWIQTTNTPPNKPSITGKTHGNAGDSYDYTFTATDPDESIIWYYVNWGDGSSSGWVGPYNSDEQMTLSHSWNNKGTYNVSAKAKDPYGAEGPWGYLEVTMPVNLQNSYQQSQNSLLLRIIQQLISHPKLIKLFKPEK